MKKIFLSLFAAFALLNFTAAAGNAAGKRQGQGNDTAGTFEYAVEKQDTREILKHISKADPAEKNTKLNKQYSNGLTPLAFAVINGNEEMARILVGHGADINLPVRGDYPFALAVRFENDGIINYMESTGQLNEESYNRALLEAAGPFVNAMIPKEQQWWEIRETQKKDNIELFKRLAERGADIKKNEAELLQRAANNGNEAILKFLLAAGANPNAKENSYDSTPVFDAVLLNDKNAVTILLEHGADINAKSFSGITPVFLAVQDEEREEKEKENIQMLKYLVNNGADLNVAARDGETPLSEACRVWNFQTVKFLVENGADINAASVLPFSIEKRGTRILAYLLSNGADVKTESGSVALLAAMNADNDEAVKLLKSYGASIEKAGNGLPVKYRRFKE